MTVLLSAVAYCPFSTASPEKCGPRINKDTLWERLLLWGHQGPETVKSFRRGAARGSVP